MRKIALQGHGRKISEAKGSVICKTGTENGLILWEFMGLFCPDQIWKSSSRRIYRTLGDDTSQDGKEGGLLSREDGPVTNLSGPETAMQFLYISQS